MTWIRSSLSVAAFVSMAANGALADEYPTHPVRLVVPYAAGGPSDAGARLLTQPLGRHLGGTVFVENRGGAGGITGTEGVVHAENDGYTLLLGAIGPLVFIPVAKTVQYNVRTDLIPLGLIWRSPLVLVVNPKRGINTIDEFIAFAKANPGKLTLTSAGIGTNTHMAIELFRREAGIDILHVPYRGTGAALPDLLSGQVDGTISDVALMTPLVRAGKLLALAVTAPERSPLLPEVRTMAEAGLPNAHTENWYGLLAPGRTPPQVVEKLKTALDSAVNDPTFRDGLSEQGAVIGESGAANFARLIESETRRWAPIIRDSGVKF